MQYFETHTGFGLVYKLLIQYLKIHHRQKLVCTKQAAIQNQSKACTCQRYQTQADSPCALTNCTLKKRGNRQKLLNGYRSSRLEGMQFVKGLEELAPVAVLNMWTLKDHLVD